VGASRAWLITATLGVAACKFDAALVEGYQCGVDDRCPSGLMCVEDLCVSGVADVDAGPDPDATPAAVGCGGLGLLRDEFADATRGPQWDFFEDPGATIAETGGHLAITVAANAGGPYAGYISSYRYDLTSSSITTEVTAIAGRNTILEIRNSVGERAQLAAGVDDLEAAVYGGPAEGTRTTIPYDAVAQRWWRFREADGTLYWEYSANGSSWTALHSEASPIDVTHVRGIVSAGDALVTASEARFEVINPDAPSVGFCAASTLVDPLDGQLQPNWEFWEDACDLTITGGRVQMSYPTGVGEAWCGFGSNHIYDLTESAIYIDAMGVALATNFTSYFQVMDAFDGETRAEIGREGGSIAFVQRVDGVEVDTEYDPYDATADRYWKIALVGADLVFQTSPDASTWVTHLTVAAGFDVSATRIVVGAGHYSPGPGTPVTTTFHGLNTP